MYMQICMYLMVNADYKKVIHHRGDEKKRREMEGEGVRNVEKTKMGRKNNTY